MRIPHGSVVKGRCQVRDIRLKDIGIWMEFKIKGNEMTENEIWLEKGAEDQTEAYQHLECW